MQSVKSESAIRFRCDAFLTECQKDRGLIEARPLRDEIHSSWRRTTTLSIQLSRCWGVLELPLQTVCGRSARPTECLLCAAIEPSERIDPPHRPQQGRRITELKGARSDAIGAILGSHFLLGAYGSIQIESPVKSETNNRSFESAAMPPKFPRPLAMHCSVYPP